MQTEYDKQWNLISGPPSLYYGSDQYSACLLYTSRCV